MVPTAEVPLTGLHMDEILDEASLPRTVHAYTPCFRREKMSAGRDVRGIKRGHQFDKVEMYIYCKPEDSDAGARENAGRRRRDLRRAGLDLPRLAAVHRRPGLWRDHHLRPRSLGAGLRRVAGSFVGLERDRFPGPPRQHQIPPGGWRRPACCTP
jgi:hypothetical protein